MGGRGATDDNEEERWSKSKSNYVYMWYMSQGGGKGHTGRRREDKVGKEEKCRVIVFKTVPPSFEI